MNLGIEMNLGLDLAWFSGYVAFHALLVTLLAFNVSRLRVTLKIAHGDGGKIPMRAAIRAHGNAIEHVLIFGFLVLALVLEQADVVLVGFLVCAFAVSRVMHAAGMLTTAFQFRRVGALSTYFLELVGIVALPIVMM